MHKLLQKRTAAARVSVHAEQAVEACGVEATVTRACDACYEGGVVVEEDDGLQLHLVLSAAYAVPAAACDGEEGGGRGEREGGEGANTKT